jgi:hypothetical protein
MTMAMHQIGHQGSRPHQARLCYAKLPSVQTTYNSDPTLVLPYGRAMTQRIMNNVEIIK